MRPTSRDLRETAAPSDDSSPMSTARLRLCTKYSTPQVRLAYGIALLPNGEKMIKKLSLMGTPMILVSFIFSHRALSIGIGHDEIGLKT